MTSNISDKNRKPKSTSTLSWVSDKLAAGAARVNGGEFQDIEVAVVKATNHDVTPPKEKHVRTLREVIATCQNRKKIVYIIHALYERLVLPNETWLVVLKTLMVFHKLMKTDGENTLKQEMVKYKEKRKLNGLLSLSNFQDETGRENWDYSAFVRVYSLYLDERLTVFENINFDVERDTGSEGVRFKSATSQELLNELPRIQKMLQRIMACVPEGTAASSEIVLECMRWILTECFRLFRIISEGVITLAEQFFEMDRVDARKGLEMYKEAVNSTNQMQSFFSAIQALNIGTQIQFPQLQSPPEDFIEQMEEYVKDATGRAVTRKFPSTILRTARGGPSAAIAPGVQTSSATNTNVPVTKIELSAPPQIKEEPKESGQGDLLSLDALDLNTQAVSQPQPVAPTNPTDPFGDTVFGGQNPVVANTAASDPGKETSGFLDDWNQPHVGASPMAGSSATAQEQGNSPFDDFFGGGPMAQPPPPPHQTMTQQPPPPPPQQTMTQQPPPPFTQNVANNFNAPPPVGLTFQPQVQPISNNPFGDSGFVASSQTQNPVSMTQIPLQTQDSFSKQFQYTGHASQFTGPGAFADPFDGLNPSLQKKPSNIPAGTPMRSETNDVANPFGTTTTAGTGTTTATTNTQATNQHQQDFTSFF